MSQSYTEKETISSDKDLAIMLQAFHDNIKRLRTNPLMIRGTIDNDNPSVPISLFLEFRVLALDLRPVLSESFRDPSSIFTIVSESIKYLIKNGDYLHAVEINAIACNSIIFYKKVDNISFFQILNHLTLEEKVDKFIYSQGVHLNGEKAMQFYEMSENDKDNLYKQISLEVNALLAMLTVFETKLIALQSMDKLPEIKNYVKNFSPLSSY